MSMFRSSFAATLAVTVLATSVEQAFAADIYVNKSNPTPGSGGSWAQSFATLQQGLAAAAATPGSDTVRIAAGIYHVDEGLPGAATREDTFFIPAGTTIFAGYPTTGNPGEGDRNPLRYPVILSADLDRNDNYPDFEDGIYTSLASNSYHCIVMDDEATVGNTLISGVTVQGGNADDGTLADPSKGRGGGMYLGDGTPFIRNCRLQWNRAERDNLPPAQDAPIDGLGGGIYSRDGGLLHIRDTTFYQNHASWGGGIYKLPTPSTDPQTSTLLVGCVFLKNQGVAPVGSSRGAGAIFGFGAGKVDIISCDFALNECNNPEDASGGGAALVIEPATAFHLCEGQCSSCTECTEDCVGAGSCPAMDCPECPTNVVVTNTVFRANVGRGLTGGAIRLNRKTAFNNCVFVANETESGLGGAAMVIGHRAFVQFNHCILWGNRAPEASGLATELQKQVWLAGALGIPSAYSKFDAAYCVIQGLSDPQLPGTPSPDPLSPGNIEADPEFVVAPHPGTDDEWGTSDDEPGDLRLRPDSPCIDAGDDDLLPPDTGDIDESSSTSEDLPLDLPYRPRSVDGECGGGDPVVDMGAYEYGCFGDLNGDCAVNGMDSALLLAAWNTAGYFPCPLYELEDLDRNCKIDSRDLALLLAAWGDCPEVGGGEGAAPLGGGEGSSEDEVFAMLWQWYVEENWAALLEWAISQLP